jgi:hypothetical protein
LEIFTKRKSMLFRLKTGFLQVFLRNCSIWTQGRRNLRLAQNCTEDSCASISLVEIKNTSCLLSFADLVCKDLLNSPLRPLWKLFLVYILTCPGLSYRMAKNRPRYLFLFGSYSICNHSPSILKWIVVHTFLFPTTPVTRIMVTKAMIKISQFMSKHFKESIGRTKCGTRYIENYTNLKSV